MNREFQIKMPISKSHSARGLFNPSYLVPIVIFVLIVVVGLVPRIIRGFELNHIHEELKTDIPEVSAIRVEAAEKHTTLLLPGDLQPIQNIPIYARANGYILKRFVDIGDIVKAGDLLAIIDTPELDQQVQQTKANLRTAQANLASAISDRQHYKAEFLAARAAIEQAKTNLDYSHVQIQRYKDLADEGAVSYEMKDQWLKQFNSDTAALQVAQENEKSALAQEASADAQIAAAKQTVESNEANVRQLQALQGFQRVTAPSAGVITDRLVDAGALVAAGGAQGTTQLLTMAKTDILRIYVDVPQSDYRYIHTGDRADILLQEFPGRSFKGIVTNIAGSLNSMSRTLQTEIRIDNKDEVLRPGAYAQVKFVFNRDNPPVVIPSNAMVTKNDGPYVVSVVDDKIQYRHIDICRDYGNKLEICDGLKANDIIVVSPSDNLKDGDKIKPLIAKLSE
jgi:RND family efflux transporter MFP subunit